MKKILLILMAMFAFGIQNITAQDGIKIITGHPDLNIKIKRCVASGKNVVLDMTVTNESENDASMRICMGNGDCTIHDGEGNEYRGGWDGPVVLKVANNAPGQWVERLTLIAGVPTNLKWTIKGVPNSVESIARMQFRVECEAWSLNEKVTIRNIPISRN